MKGQQLIESALSTVCAEMLEANNEHSALALAKQAVLLRDAIDVAYDVDPLDDRARKYLQNKRTKKRG